MVFFDAENTPKLPLSQIACCSPAHAHEPVVEDAAEDVCGPGAHLLAHDAEGAGENRLQSVVATGCRHFVNWSTCSAPHLTANI